MGALLQKLQRAFANIIIAEIPPPWDVPAYVEIESRVLPKPEAKTTKG